MRWRLGVCRQRKAYYAALEAANKNNEVSDRLAVMVLRMLPAGLREYGCDKYDPAHAAGGSR